MALKERRGGKYYNNLINASGYYGNNEAGTPREFNATGWGTKREFVGSNTSEYTFFDNTHGMHTITAQSYEEALRIAKSMGYTAGDYQKRRGKR